MPQGESKRNKHYCLQLSAWENHQLIIDNIATLFHSLGGDHSARPWQRAGTVGEGGPAHPDDTIRGARWRTGSRSWFLEHCDEREGREELSSPTFDLQWIVSSAMHEWL